MTARLAFAACALCLLAAAPARATDLYTGGTWPALATDRNARHVGDILEIVVYETAAATNTASNSADRNSGIGGHVSAGPTFNQSGSLALQSTSDTTGTTGRSGGIVAQVSVRVDEVLANGDLRVSGAQTLNVNGEKTNIRIKGVLRTADIAPDNTVLSSRLADAAIDYDGSGFVTRSAAPGLVARLFNWLGL